MTTEAVIKKTLFRFHLNGKSFDDLIRDGKYDHVNSKINKENFPVGKLGNEDIVLKIINTKQLSRGKSLIGTEDVLSSLKEQGLVPAGIKELLAFGMKYPEIQRQKCIIALGSTIKDDRGNAYAPCLSGHDDERNVGLVWLKGGWNSTDSFAVI